MRHLLSCVSFCLLATAAVARPPMPVESEWLVTKFGSILVNGDPKGRAGTTQYQLEFELREPVTETLFVTVDFENPADKDSPLFAEFEVAPGATKIEAKSEKMPAIRNRHKYKVKVWIYADVKRKQLLGTHEQLVLFDAPAELLERFGVTLL